MKKPEVYKHYVYRDIGMIKGYKLSNETNENENVIINIIKIEINMESEIGNNFYNTIKDKLNSETLKNKYISNENYIYSEKENDGIYYIEIKILTNKLDQKDIKAKQKLLHEINKYT